jgi:hypothetical protein
MRRHWSYDGEREFLQKFAHSPLKKFELRCNKLCGLKIFKESKNGNAGFIKVAWTAVED